VEQAQLTVSVLICTRNRPQDIVWCLPAVLANDYPNFQVVVVDQSDGSETAGMVNKLAEGCANLVYLPTDTRGKSLALNLGVKACTGDIIACTDDDCEMQPGWIAHVASLFGSEPDLDMVFGQVHMPDNLPEDDVAVPCLYFTERRRLNKGDIFGMGANMAFRRSLYDRLFGYDDILGPGAPLACSEDFDFLYRAQRLDAKCVAEPSLVLVHRAHRTREFWERVMYAYGVGDAGFYLKHARCGDVWAGGVFGMRILKSLARGVLGKPFGRGQGQASYLRGLWSGALMSYHYGIDRAHRMYRPVKAGEGRAAA
jgi:glycosyltransferase involved in cell wall biosynthesis